MKMIEVMIKLANGEIKDQTTLKIYDHADTLYTSYTFEEKLNSFYSNTKYRIGLGDYFKINGDFLNYEVELIPQEEIEYLIKVNVRGLAPYCEYLNYLKPVKGIVLSDRNQNYGYKTHFTKKEMQEIKPVREFLQDMEGKYQLIEAK